MRKRRHIVVLGFSMVGKTAICVRFAADRFTDRYEPTFQTSHHKMIKQRSDEIEVFITDTQGQDDQETFRKEYCLGAHGYVFVYSVTSTKSLEACVALNAKLTGLMGTSNTPRILVGNKIDQEKDRVISTMEGAALAEKLGCKFMECSAKQNVNIDKVFSTLLKEIDRLSDEDENSSSTCTCIPIPWCPSDHNEEGYKLKILLNCLIAATLLLGLIGIIIGLAIGLKADLSNDGDLVAYILFGFGLFTTLVSALGLAGVWKRNREFLRVYSGTLSVILIFEVVVGAFLFIGVPLLKQNALRSIVSMTVTFTIHISYHRYWRLVGFKIFSTTAQILPCMNPWHHHLFYSIVE